MQTIETPTNEVVVLDQPAEQEQFMELKEISLAAIGGGLGIVCW